MLLDLYNQVLNDRAQIIIGKNGITDGLFKHIKESLKRLKIIKLKIMRDQANEKGLDHFILPILNNLKVYILDVRGFTFIISKKKITGVHMPKKYLEFTSISKMSQDAKSPKKNQQIQENKNEVHDNNSSEKNIDNNATDEKINFVEPEFIDYDDENLVARLDNQNDEFYGEVTPAPIKKQKDRTTKKPVKKTFDLNTNKRKFTNKKGAKSPSSNSRFSDKSSKIKKLSKSSGKFKKKSKFAKKSSRHTRKSY